MQFEVGEEAQQHLLAAAKLHGKEADIAQTFRNLVPRHHMSDEEILRKTEPENRKLLAKVILVCNDLYEQAINHIERALAAEEVEGEFPQRKRPSEEGEVVIQSPLPKEFVSSPLVIQGNAKRGWFFEGEIDIELVDANGKVVKRWFGRALAAKRFPFRAEVEFSAPSTNAGELVIFKETEVGVRTEYHLPIRFHE